MHCSHKVKPQSESCRVKICQQCKDSCHDYPSYGPQKHLQQQWPVLLQTTLGRVRCARLNELHTQHHKLWSSPLCDLRKGERCSPRNSGSDNSSAPQHTARWTGSLTIGFCVATQVKTKTVSLQQEPESEAQGNKHKKVAQHVHLQ